MRKKTSLIRCFVSLTIVLTVCLTARAQFEKYSVPAKWELYSAADKKVSFLMPRLPILIESGDRCRGEITQIYGAYTGGVAYTVRITSKVDVPKSCSQSVRKDFDETNFLDRVKELKTNLTASENTTNNISEGSVIKLSGTDKVVNLVNDYENKRWFELAAEGGDERKIDVKNFLASLKTGPEAGGQAIGEGAPQVYGDAENVTAIDVVNPQTGKIEKSNQLLIKTDGDANTGIVIVLKARARYTDQARTGNVQGRVLLRVTFLANGGIGNIVVVSGLEKGLTEQAIAAARKILFLPGQIKGTRVSIVKPVEYNFSIY